MDTSQLAKTRRLAYVAWLAGPGQDGGKVTFTLTKAHLEARQELEGGDYVLCYEWDGTWWKCIS
jgi:hypothetical protein